MVSRTTCVLLCAVAFLAGCAHGSSEVPGGDTLRPSNQEPQAQGGPHAPAGAEAASAEAARGDHCRRPALTLETLDHSFDSYGPAVGDIASDTPLTRLNGEATTLRGLLAESEAPVLLMAGSWTCPVARRVFPKLEEVARERPRSLRVVFVYVVEPHPADSPSPYSGEVWVTKENRQDAILESQPGTMAERLALARGMAEQLAFDVPIVVDDMCDAYWTTYGPAPNNAYLISADGVILAKHGWFDQAPWSIDSDLDAILGALDER